MEDCPARPSAHGDDVSATRVEARLDRTAAYRGSHVALVSGERRWTYSDLQAESRRRAGVLAARGIVEGDVVLTSAHVTDDLVLAFLACCRVGAVLLAVSEGLTPREMADIVERSCPKAVLLGGDQRHGALQASTELPLDLRPESSHSRTAPEAKFDIDAAAAIRATSGSTGSVPKLVVMPHRQLTWRQSAPSWWETPDEVFCLPFPLHFAVMDICQFLGLGATVVLTSGVDPDRLEREMVRTGTTVLCTVPAVARLLARAQHQPPNALALTAIRTSAADLPAPIAQAISARYRTRVVQQWASTESYTALTTPQGGCPEGSIGKPVAGVRVQIVNDDGLPVNSGEVGELLVRTPGMMLGYLDDPVETASALSDGWLHLGDLAWQDADGFIYLAGRRSQRINVGGWKVSPEEVEAVLMQHASVKLAAVTPFLDASHGEIVRAIIVPEGEPPTLAELRRFCRARLANHKVPRVIEFRDAIPLSPLGKVLRHRL